MPIRRRRPEPRLWRHEHLLAPLVPLAYLERASAHVLLGWLPKVETIDLKIALGRLQHTHLVTARRLERTYWAMTRLHGGGDPGVPTRLRTFMRALDGAADAAELVARLYLEVRPAIARRTAALVAKADPVLDAHLLEVLGPAQTESERQVGWARSIVRPRRGQRERVADLLEPGRGGSRLAREEWLWRPLDRLPECARAAQLDRIKPGTLAPSLSDPPGSKGAVGEFLHHVTGSELSTMELYGRCSYEHPDMPEEFHEDYARVTADEARHAALALEQATALGRPYGSLPIDTTLYESLYSFNECPPGSRKELLWRLLLQGTLREGLIIEGFSLQAKKMRYLKRHTIARLIETIAEEEVPHVEIALRWARHLCGGDKEKARRERERAHSRYRDDVVSARKRYVAKHADEAIAETERFQAYAKVARSSFPFSLITHVNRPVRKAIGFTDREIDQVIGWGYLAP